MEKTVVAILTAAGSGKRLGENLPKALIPLTDPNVFYSTNKQTNIDKVTTTVYNTNSIEKTHINDTFFDTPVNIQSIYNEIPKLEANKEKIIDIINDKIDTLLQEKINLLEATNNGGTNLENNLNKHTNKPKITILEYALESLLSIKEIGHIVVTIPEKNKEQFENIIKSNKTLNVSNLQKIHLVIGGNSRQNSIHKALQFIKNNLTRDISYSETSYTKSNSNTENKKYSDFAVLIHDAARCFTPNTLVTNLIKTFYLNLSTNENYGVIPVLPVVDTLKEITNFNTIGNQTSKTVNRSKYYRVQTPQIFNLKNMINLHEKYEKNGENEKTAFTDDSSMIENSNGKIYHIIGDELAFKITTPADLIYARNLYSTNHS